MIERTRMCSDRPSTPGQERARAADDAVDLDARPRRPVQRLDRRPVDDRVDLDDDPGLAAGRGVLDLALDELEEPRAQAVRRDEQPPERALARQPGQDVEQVGDVGAELRPAATAARGRRTAARSSGCSCRSRCGRSGGGRSPRAGRRAQTFEWVLRPTRPYTTWAPACSSWRAQTMFASSSKRALISTRTTTCLPRSAARIRSRTIGESPDVR